MVSLERGIELRQSRLSFFYNYVLVSLVLIFLALAWSEFNLTFTFFPRDFSEFSRTFAVFLFVGLIALLLEEPAVRRWFLRYVITNNEVIKVEGIIRKKRTIIPYQSVANVQMYKGILGRMLNFGDVDVVGFKNQINMKGIREPETFYRIINNKIAVMRGTAPKIVGAAEKETEAERIEAIDWKKEQKVLTKTGILGVLKRRVAGPAEEIRGVGETEESEIESPETKTGKKKAKRKKRKKKSTEKTKKAKEK